MTSDEIAALDIIPEELERIIKLETSKPTQAGMYLHLYHGRANPGQEMDEWGDDGPMFGPLKWASVTYMENLRICPMGDDDPIDAHMVCRMPDGRLMRDPMFIKDGLIHYDGMYYGDWSIDYVEGAATAEVQTFSNGDNDQVTTCPKCGARSEFLDRNAIQLHWCMNDKCNHIFLLDMNDD